VPRPGGRHAVGLTTRCPIEIRFEPLLTDDSGEEVLHGHQLSDQRTKPVIPERYQGDTTPSPGAHGPGSVTDGYRADREIVRLLNEALATEIVCVLRYRRHHCIASSARIRRRPQVGFSRAMRRMRRRSSGSSLGRPTEGVQSEAVRRFRWTGSGDAVSLKYFPALDLAAPCASLALAQLDKLLEALQVPLDPRRHEPDGVADILDHALGVIIDLEH
jgi:hypothetical protein